MGFTYSTEAIRLWRLDDFMKVIDKYEDVFSDCVNNDTSSDEEYKKILININGKVLVTVREILTLCAHGYPDGALSLARNLFEQMVIVQFFEKKKSDDEFLTVVGRYDLDFDVQRLQSLKSIQEFGLNNEDSKRLGRELEELKQKEGIKRINRYWWSGYSSFSALCEYCLKPRQKDDATNFLASLYAEYKRACISIHANTMGNAIRLGKDSNIGFVDTSPSLKGQEAPLFLASSALIAIICITCVNFEIDYSKFQRALNELAIFYQSKLGKDSIS